LAGCSPPHRAHRAGVSCFLTVCCLVRSAAFNADVWFVAVSVCMSVLLTSRALDDICFIGVWRFYSYTSVLKTCYVADFLLFGAGSKSTKNGFSGSLVDF
jgi:hypothetical protein